jgi:hypothetical protein
MYVGMAGKATKAEVAFQCMYLCLHPYTGIWYQLPDKRGGMGWGHLCLLSPHAHIQKEGRCVLCSQCVISIIRCFLIGYKEVVCMYLLVLHCHDVTDPESKRFIHSKKYIHVMLMLP